VASEGTERRLAAIMFTDIVGYTAATAESGSLGLVDPGGRRDL
jgi:class 3 adenylate cyclase